MTNLAKILRYLSSGQATSRAISDCYSLPHAVVDAICQQLVEEKKAASYQLGDHPEITVYRLTNQNELLTRNPTESAEPLLNSELRRRQVSILDLNLRRQFTRVCSDVAKHYNVDARAMRSKSRKDLYTWPRYVVMKVLNSLGWSLQSIADAFDYGCHSTISHGLRSHAIRTRTDSAMHEITLSLIEKHREPKASEAQCQIIAALTQHLQLP